MFDFIPISNDLFVTAFGIYFRFCLISFFALFGLFIAVKYSNEIDKILTRFKHIRSLRAHNIITFKYQFGLLVLSSLFFFSFVRFSIFRCIQKITFNHYKNKTNEFFTLRMNSKTHKCIAMDVIHVICGGRYVLVCVFLECLFLHFTWPLRLWQKRFKRAIFIFPCRLVFDVCLNVLYIHEDDVSVFSQFNLHSPNLSLHTCTTNQWFCFICFYLWMPAECQTSNAHCSLYMLMCGF